MTKAVFGLANSEEHADRIVEQLQQAGFKNDEISVLISDREGKYKNAFNEHGELNYSDRQDFDRTSDRQDLNHPVGKKDFSKNKKGSLVHEKHTKAPEGAAAGATTGGIIGGSIGLLAGIGALAIPGLGALIAAGPILAALSGSAVGGALGLLVGSLVGLGIPEYEAKKYETSIKAGKALICVHAANSNLIDKAKRTLEHAGAKDIAVSGEKTSSSR